MSNEEHEARLVRMVAELLVALRRESPNARAHMLAAARDLILTWAKFAPERERQIRSTFDAAEREMATWQ